MRTGTPAPLSDFNNEIIEPAARPAPPAEASPAPPAEASPAAVAPPPRRPRRHRVALAQGLDPVLTAIVVFGTLQVLLLAYIAHLLRGRR